MSDGITNLSRTLPSVRKRGRQHSLQAGADGSFEATTLINIKQSPTENTDFLKACAQIGTGESVVLRTLIEALRSGAIAIDYDATPELFARVSFLKSGFAMVPAKVTKNDAQWFDAKFGEFRRHPSDPAMNIKANVARYLMRQFSLGRYPHIKPEARQTFSAEPL